MFFNRLFSSRCRKAKQNLGKINVKLRVWCLLLHQRTSLSALSEQSLLFLHLLFTAKVSDQRTINTSVTSS